MDDNAIDHLAYYEQEALARTRKEPTGRRVELRDRFVELLGAEGRTRVIDYGAGPGSDGHGFRAAGLTYVGLDLARGNGALAAEAGLTVIQASIDAPPFRDHWFDAGWSMSTLMHLPAEQVPTALAAMARPLRPGAPLHIAVWGGDQGVESRPSTNGTVRRQFHYRTFEENRELMATAGSVEHEEQWEPFFHPKIQVVEEYQVFRIRLPD